jgi:hypothetical protein
MKKSHLITPRQLSDCAFVPSADPIERHHSRVALHHKVLYVLAVVAAVLVWVTR